MAAATQARAIFEELFVCSVCLQPFEDPKLLPCLHSFCENCLERHYQIDSKRRRAVSDSASTKVSCPSCRVLVIVPDGQVSKFHDDSSVRASRDFLKDCYGSENAEEMDTGGSDDDQKSEEARAVGDSNDDVEEGELRETLRTGVMQVQYTLVKLRSKIMEIVLLMDHLEDLKRDQLKIIEQSEEENHAHLTKALHDSYRPALARLGAHLEKLYNVACERKSVYGIVEELVEKGNHSQLQKAMENVKDLLEAMQTVPAAVHIDLREALGELDVNISDIELQIPNPVSGMETCILPHKIKPIDLDVTKYLICRLSRAGRNPGQFNFPVHATFLPDGGFMVCDKKNERIQIFDKMGKFERLFLSNRIKPRRAKLNPIDGLIYISNEHTECIKVYNMKEECVKCIGERFFQCPAGLDFDSKGNVVMTDAEKATVSIHTPDDKQLNKWAFSYFNTNVPCPYFSAVTSEDHIVVSDYRNNEVRAFTPMGRELFRIDGLECPRGVCVDKDDNILVAEGDAHRVSLYSPYGKFLKYVLTEEDGLQYPMSVDMDDEQRLLVTQFGVHRSEVMIFHVTYELSQQEMY